MPQQKDIVKIAIQMPGAYPQLIQLDQVRLWILCPSWTLTGPQVLETVEFDVSFTPFVEDVRFLAVVINMVPSESITQFSSMSCGYLNVCSTGNNSMDEAYCVYPLAQTNRY